MFDHERLDVYQLLLRFIAWQTELVESIRGAHSRKTREVRGQLDRASLSGLLNTAEGNGNRHKQLRARYFDDARGSAMECAACLDALVAKGVCTAERVREGKEMLLRIVQMLTRLVFLNDRSQVVREEAIAYAADPEPLGGERCAYPSDEEAIREEICQDRELDEEIRREAQSSGARDEDAVEIVRRYREERRRSQPS